MPMISHLEPNNEDPEQVWCQRQQPVDVGHLYILHPILHPGELNILLRNHITHREDEVIVGDNCKRKNKY
jgi:hypothetical protein